jgi:flagellar motor switch protein FliG
MARRPKSENGEGDEYTGPTRVAVFLLAMGPEMAGLILRHMERETVEDLTREIASLGVIPAPDQQKIVEEYYSIVLAKQDAAEGGLGYARMGLIGTAKRPRPMAKARRRPRPPMRASSSLFR